MISVIFARDKNNLIGDNNKMPWYIPEDFKWFKEKTNGKICVAGRKTWESIGKKLPNRECHLLTKSGSNPFGLISWDSIDGFLAQKLNTEEEIFFIGGVEIWKQIHHLVHKYYITEINDEFNGTDWYAPDLNNFNKIYSEIKPNLEFTIWQRK